MNRTMRINWTKVIIFSLILFALVYLYIGVETGFSVYTLNRALAINAVVLIGLSLGSASFIYFTKRFQNKLVYRMYLGVAGFFFGLVHGLTSEYFYFFVTQAPKPNYQFDKVWHIAGNLYIPNQIAFLFGITALVIFAFMALISIRYFILRFGGVTWRLLLRYLGYTAFVMIMCHFLIKNFDYWLRPSTWHVLPPESLLLWIFCLTVVGLRLALWRSLAVKKTKVTAPVQG
jgi:hypothetical protein